MSGIRGKDTQPELGLRRALHRLGLRYRLHVTGLPGRPDIVLPKHHSEFRYRAASGTGTNNARFALRPHPIARFWKIEVCRNGKKGQAQP